MLLINKETSICHLVKINILSGGNNMCSRVTGTYKTKVRKMLKASTDLWGDYLISTQEGPTFRAVKDLLNPLMYVGHKPCEQGWLTESEIYYLPFGIMDTPMGGSTFALHVADGSEIISDRFDGQKLSIFVGSNGNELYGSHIDQLEGPQLYNQYLPILQTWYTDSQGVKFFQESFATRISETDSLVSYVHIHIDRGSIAKEKEIVLVPSDDNLNYSQDRLVGQKGTYYIVSPGGHFDGQKLTYKFTPDCVNADIYLIRLNNPTSCDHKVACLQDYEAARELTISYWEAQLAEAAVNISIPEKLVENAKHNLLIQNLLMNWRYSIGNLYETEFNAESSDSIQALGLFGHTKNYKAGIQKMLDGPNQANWEKGIRLKQVAYYYHLTKDSSLVTENHSKLLSFAKDFEKQVAQDPNGLLKKEPGGTDISDPNKLMYSLHFQVDCWRGLRDMATVWGMLGYSDLERQFSKLADHLKRAIRRAVDTSKQYLDDGSLYIPVSLLDPAVKKPYDPITSTTEGSYWLLVAPNSYASGFFEPYSPESKAILKYLHNHGAILLGMLRFNYRGEKIGSCKVDGWSGMRASGVDNVYAVSYARFLADNDEADRLIMTFYGKLAHGMTDNTFICGEGEEIDICGDDYYRSMYLPPNSTNNSLFLHTLRLMLVRETTDHRGIGQNLHLAHATPSNWLAHGQLIKVTNMPTLFGQLSYTIISCINEGYITVDLDIPTRDPIDNVYLRLRTPYAQPIKRVEQTGQTESTIRVEGETIHLGQINGKTKLTVYYENN